VEKFGEYERAGVPEYWVVDPEMRAFEAYSLGTGHRYTKIGETAGKVHSRALIGLHFRPSWVCQLHLPKYASLVSEMSAERARLLSSPPPPPSDKPVG
jgi:hypothetical protein